MVVNKSQITKVCMRHLPPDLTGTELLEMIESDLPPYDHFQFHPGDPSLAPLNMTRAYFNFPLFDHVIEMQSKFDGQIFESKKGAEYTCQVEAASFQATPKPKEKEDKYTGTLDEDEHYKAFLAEYEAEEAPVEQINVDQYLTEAAQKEEDRKKPISTPLIDFIRQKKDKKKQARNERRKQENDRRKDRNDERKKHKQAERKEKQSRKKELIDSKNSESSKGGEKQSDEKKEGGGGRVAARERRKKEAEERRKTKVAERKKERAESNHAEGGEKQHNRNNKGKRYSKRNEKQQAPQAPPPAPPAAAAPTTGEQAHTS